jgi:hypothetical protein
VVGRRAGLKFCTSRCRQAAYRARQRRLFSRRGLSRGDLEYLLDMTWADGFEEGKLRTLEVFDPSRRLPPQLLRQVLALCHPDRHPGRERQATAISARLSQWFMDERKPLDAYNRIQAPPRPRRKRNR